MLPRTKSPQNTQEETYNHFAEAFISSVPHILFAIRTHTKTASVSISKVIIGITEKLSPWQAVLMRLLLKLVSCLLLQLFACN